MHRAKGKSDHNHLKDRKGSLVKTIGHSNPAGFLAARPFFVCGTKIGVVGNPGSLGDQLDKHRRMLDGFGQHGIQGISLPNLHMLLLATPGASPGQFLIPQLP